MSEKDFFKDKQESVKMKHPSTNLECIEFNLGKAPTLRCVNHQKTTVCGECETCILAKKVPDTKDWLGRIGDKSKRRFVLGLIRHLHSIDLMQYVVNLLQPLLCKDFTYARARSNPSMPTDKATMSSDRALPAIDVEQQISETWFWFQNSSYCTKSNFVWAVLQTCESHLLYLVGTQAKSSLLSEQKAHVIKGKLK